MSLYHSYYPKIYGFFYRDCLHRETAEDLAATTFTKALQFIQLKKKEIINFNAWIYRIATNELYSYLKQLRRRRARIVENTEKHLIDGLPDETQRPDECADFWPVRDAVAQLPPEKRVLIEMHFFEKMDYSEMAEALKCKEATLRSKIHRTLKLLRTFLNKGDRERENGP